MAGTLRSSCWPLNSVSAYITWCQWTLPQGSLVRLKWHNTWKVAACSRHLDWRCLIELSVMIGAFYILCCPIEQPSAVTSASKEIAFYNSKKEFIYFWERESRGETEREGDRESQAGSALRAQRPTHGLNSGIARSWPELKSRVGHLAHWATQVSQEMHFKSYLI